MEIEFDEAKRQVLLELRGLDFAEAATIFNAPNATLPDRRRDYGEVRYLTHGLLRGEVVMVVWTPRGSVDGSSP